MNKSENRRLFLPILLSLIIFSGGILTSCNEKTSDISVEITEASAMTTVSETESTTVTTTETSANTTEITVITTESTVTTVETTAAETETSPESETEITTERQTEISTVLPEVVETEASTEAEEIKAVETTAPQVTSPVIKDPMSVIMPYIDSLQAELNNTAHDESYKQEGFRDRVIIPDRMNTGIEKGVVLKKFDKSGLIGNISEEEKAKGRKQLFLGVGKEEPNTFYNVNGYSNPSCAEEIFIEGYDFSDAKFYTTNDWKLPSVVKIYFKNCKFGRIQSYPGDNLWLIFDHCQTEGNASAINMIFTNCYLHSDGGDAFNPDRNFLVKDCYVADLFRHTSDKIVHIDGAHLFGDQYGGISENVIFDNVRFSIPQLTFPDCTSYVNAAIATGIEFSEARNFLFQNIMIDTGGRWYPIYNTGGDDVLFRNIKVANGYKRIFYPSYINPNAKVVDVDFSDGLYVSSVWKDADNRTHFLCSNNNMKTDKNLKVVTDKKEYTFHIDRHPLPGELWDQHGNAVFKDYRFKDLPYDIEFVIEENISSAEFFDEDKKIRAVKFD